VQEEKSIQTGGMEWMVLIRMCRERPNFNNSSSMITIIGITIIIIIIIKSI
jgi:hypothetical protein